MTATMQMKRIPLFPLNTVIFPQGLLPLRIFEQRYLDMVKHSFRLGAEFGVVLASDRADLAYPFFRVGTEVRIVDFDVPEIGLIHIRCRAGQRFRIHDAHQQSDGLWLGQVETVADDLQVAVPDDLRKTAGNLRQLIDALLKQGFTEDTLPIAKPYQLDDCAWVANRWVELLHLPLEQKQRLLELDSPMVRLELVQDMFPDVSGDKDE